MSVPTQEEIARAAWLSQRFVMFQRGTRDGSTQPVDEFDEWLTEGVTNLRMAALNAAFLERDAEPANRRYKSAEDELKAVRQLLKEVLTRTVPTVLSDDSHDSESLWGRARRAVSGSRLT